MADAGMFGLDTPRTVAANETMADFDITQEPSFHQPAKDNDLVRQMRGRTSPRKAAGGSFKTPARRRPLGETRNPPAGNNIPAARTEFTPLMRSVTKSNLMRAQGINAPIATPAALKPGHVANSPALPMNSSGIYDLDHTSSSLGDGDGGATPIPQLISSSVASTPLAALPRRDGGGTLADGGQMMTLREQEKIIDKIEKENFGLKLKIHFLQEQLRKSGPGFNEAALKENTDLKVDKVTLQHELKRYRKTLSQAERDLELYRQQLAEIQEKLQKRHLDAEQREQLERLQADLASREAEIDELRLRVDKTETSDEEVEKLKEEIADLEADVREKERQVDAKEDEVEGLKEQCEADAGKIERLEEKVADLEKQIEEDDSGRQAELDQAKEEAASSQAQLEEVADEVDDLKQSLERAKAELEEAKDEMQEAVEEKERAIADLEELQSEMANKSFSTKGLSRQLEEKTAKLQDELESLREEHQRLQESSTEDSQRCQLLTQQLEDAKEEFEAVKQKSTFDIERAQHERDIASRERDTLKKQATQATEDHFKVLEEKDTLQSRFDTLETESQTLQRQVQRLESSLKESNEKLRNEQDKALLNERKLRDESGGNAARLEDQAAKLRREIEELEEQHQKDREDWKNLCRAQEVRAEKAEAQATGLQRTVDTLQNSEGTLHGREMRLQEALESEKERYESEKAVLSRQVEELESEIESRKRSQNELRSDLLKAKEELRQKSRVESSSSERIQALEDEVEVLQTSLDDQAEQAKTELSEVRSEVDTLRRQLSAAKAELRRGVRPETDTGDAELADQLQHAEDELLRVRKEKQTANDKLANTNIELHALKQSSAELEAERDELRSQARAAQTQADGTLKLDQEKLDLRRTNLKLENALISTKEERQTLRDNCNKLEKELADEVKKASSLESRLTRTIQSLEHQIATSSPKMRSPGNSSVVLELRTQLADAYDQLKAARAKASETRQNSSEQSREAIKQLERERSLLETELADCRQRLENVQEKEVVDNLAMGRLRRKVTQLEKELRGTKADHTDRSVVAERAELHAMLKAARLETESLRAQLRRREAVSSKSQSEEMRLEIERLREDRSLFSLRAHEANLELQKLHGIVPKGAKQPVPSAQHAKELKGLTKQIVYLQARLRREMTFRSDLVFSKRFFLLQTEMFAACNTANINILEEMGLSPRKHISRPGERPSLKSVATAVRAVVRMRKGAESWSSTKKLRSQLEKGLESMKRKR